VGKRAEQLVTQLMSFSRQQPVTPKVLNLNRHIEGTKEFLKTILGKRIELGLDLSKELWKVFVDPIQIDQILSNLAVNSRDAIEGTGRVEISTENITISAEEASIKEGLKPGDYVLLTFKDNGPGIPEEIQSKVFEPFFTTKEPGKGTGLGLSSVYGIVKQNKGYIELQSKPGEGATFRIYLPRHIS
jgi:signal transduction histidine kinase